jgi:hypothetical protein
MYTKHQHSVGRQKLKHFNSCRSTQVLSSDTKFVFCFKTHLCYTEASSLPFVWVVRSNPAKVWGGSFFEKTLCKHKSFLHTIESQTFELGTKLYLGSAMQIIFV